MSREMFVSVLLVAAGFGQVRVSGFDMESPAYPMEPYCVAVNAKNGEMYAADSGVLVIGRPGLRPEARIAAGTFLLNLAYCEPEDKLYGAPYLDYALIVLDCASRSVLGRVPLGRPPGLLLYARAVNRLLVAIRGTQHLAAQLLVLDCAADSLVDSVILDSISIYGPRALRFNPATHRVYWVPYRGRPAVIDLGTGSVRVLDNWASDVAVNATGTKVWLACGDSIAVLDGATDSLLAWVDVDTAWGEVEHLLYNRRFDKVYGTAFSDGDIVQRIVAIDGAGDSLVAAIESEDLFFMIPVALTGDDRYLCHLGYMEDSFGFAVIDCERDSVVALLQSNWTQGEMVSLPGGPEVCFVAYRGVIVTIDGDARAVTDTLVTTDRYAPALLACDAERDRLYVYCDCPPDELGLVAEVEPRSGRISRFLPGFVDSEALFYSPRQYKLYFQYYDGVLGVLDLATGERRSVLREFDDLQVLGPSRTRDRFYCTAEADDEYWLLGLQGMCSLQDTVELPDQPTAVCFDPGSGRVYLAFERGTMNEVVFWQEGDDTLSAGVTIPEHVVAMQRAGARLLCFGDGKLAMLDIGLWGAIPSTVSCGCIEARCGVLCDRTGTEVYYANQDTLVALDLTWPDSTRRIPVPDIDTLIRFPGARHILCVGREEITVIDIGLDSVVQTVHVEFDPWSSAVDTIGRRVYFGEGDRTIRMLEYDYEPLLGPGPVPTIVSGSVFLAGDADCQVYDINGRRVVGLTPGENDLSRLPAGVYFARSVEGGTRSAVRKVVIQK